MQFIINLHNNFWFKLGYEELKNCRSIISSIKRIESAIGSFLTAAKIP